MTLHTRVGLIHERDPQPPSTPTGTDPAVVLAQVRALAAAVEQLSDAIDVLTETGTPDAYADEHVRRAREVLHAVWADDAGRGAGQGPTAPPPRPSLP